MNVGDLQRYLSLQAQCLEAAKAAKAAKDLQAVADQLGHFTQYDVETFSAFLQRAHTYDATGVLPVAPLKPARGKAKAPAAPKLELPAALDRVRRLYEHAVHLSSEEFQQELDRLQGVGKLAKNDLLKVAEALELFGLKNRKKDDILAQIQAKIVNRRGTAQRAEMVFPPEG
jgi:hypothetical protein